MFLQRIINVDESQRILIAKNRVII